MSIYFESGDYVNALKINSKLLDNNSNVMPDIYTIKLYINFAVIYARMNNLEKAQKYISLVKDMDSETVEHYMEILGLNSMEDLLNNNKNVKFNEDYFIAM